MESLRSGWIIISPAQLRPGWILVSASCCSCSAANLARVLLAPFSNTVAAVAETPDPRAAPHRVPPVPNREPMIMAMTAPAIPATVVMTLTGFFS